jgi:hypothetical protein
MGSARWVCLIFLFSLLGGMFPATADSRAAVDNSDSVDRSATSGKDSEYFRLQGFNEKKQQDALLNQERLKGAAEVKKNRALWEKQLSDAKQEYVRSKKQQKAFIDESSPAYKQDREAKYQQWVEAQVIQKRYSQQKKLREQQKQKAKLSAETEY